MTREFPRWWASESAFAICAEVRRIACAVRSEHHNKLMNMIALKDRVSGIGYRAWASVGYGIRATGFGLIVFLLLAGQASAATVCGYNDKGGKFTGVAGTCRTSPDNGEFNTGSTQYFFDKGINFSCPNQSCMLKQGSELCAAVAKLDGKSGEYSCNETTACASAPLSQSEGQVGGFLCTGNQVCCSPKTGMDSGSGGGGSGLTSPSGNKGTVAVPDPLNGATIPSVIGNIIRVFTGIAGSIALVVFVLGGFFFMLSEGDPGKVKNAMAMMKNGAIGIILIFGAYMITATIMNTILVQNP